MPTLKCETKKTWRRKNASSHLKPSSSFEWSRPFNRLDLEEGFWSRFKSVIFGDFTGLKLQMEGRHLHIYMVYSLSLSLSFCLQNCHQQNAKFLPLPDCFSKFSWNELFGHPASASKSHFCNPWFCCFVFCFLCLRNFFCLSQKVCVCCSCGTHQTCTLQFLLLLSSKKT